MHPGWVRVRAHGNGGRQIGFLDPLQSSFLRFVTSLGKQLFTSDLRHLPLPAAAAAGRWLGIKDKRVCACRSTLARLSVPPADLMTPTQTCKKAKAEIESAFYRRNERVADLITSVRENRSRTRGD